MLMGDTYKMLLSIYVGAQGQAFQEVFVHNDDTSQHTQACLDTKQDKLDEFERND